MNKLLTFTIAAALLGTALPASIDCSAWVYRCGCAIEIAQNDAKDPWSTIPAGPAMNPNPPLGNDWGSTGGGGPGSDGGKWTGGGGGAGGNKGGANGSDGASGTSTGGDSNGGGSQDGGGGSGASGGTPSGAAAGSEP